MPEDEQQPPLTPAEVISKMRGRAKELRGEFKPLMKDTPTPGVAQKIARRTDEFLGMFVDLCDVVERDLLPRLKK